MRARIPALLVLGCLVTVACSRTEPGGPAPSAQGIPPGVLRLEGSPRDIGTQHGSLLADRIRTMIAEYVGQDMAAGRLNDHALARVRAIKPALPEWYLEELAACAKAAQVDEDALLYAQCEGDIKSLGGCTSYVAFGPATADGAMEIGRNFDYWGLASTEKCVMVFAFVPRPKDGHAFVAVGWTGILGGWTLLNDHGLFISNNLGGFGEKNAEGVPTLIVTRILAQKAASLDEAIAIIKKTPRMRGQALVIGQTGDVRTGTAADAAVVLYDGARVEVSRVTNGFAFHSSIGTDRDRLLETFRLPNRAPTDAIRSAGTYITLHSVAIRPGEDALWVAHGRKPSAHLGEYVRHDFRSLLAPVAP